MCILCVSLWVCVCLHMVCMGALEHTLIHVIYDSFDFVWITCPCSSISSSSTELYMARTDLCYRCRIIVPFSFLLHFLPALLPKNHTHTHTLNPPTNFGNVHILAFVFCSTFIRSFVRWFQSVPVKSVFCQKLKWNKKQTNERTYIRIFVYSFVFGLVGSSVVSFPLVVLMLLLLLFVCLAFGVCFFHGEFVWRTHTPPTDVKERPLDNRMKW